MFGKRLFALVILATSVLTFADDRVYEKLNQDYENTRKLLRDAGLQEKIAPADPVVDQTLSKFKDISTDYFVPVTLDGYKKHNGDTIFNVSPRYNGLPFQLASAKEYMTGPGNSVVPFSGEFINTETDLTLPSRGGLGFSFIRTYSSYSRSDVGMGLGWRHNYDLWLSRGREQIILHLNSRDIVFQKSSEKWISGQGDFYELQEKEDGTIYVFTSDLTRYKFEKTDRSASILRLAEVASRHGKWTRNTIKLSYLQNSDRIDFVTDPFGKKINFYYNANGYLVAVATPFSFVKFTYNDNLLIKVNYTDRKNYIGCNEQYVHYRYSDTSLTRKQFSGMPFEFAIEYDNQKRVAAIGAVADNDRSKIWKFAYLDKKTIATAPFPTPQNIYSFETDIHPSLPTQIERPALNAISKLEFNKDGLVTKRIAPIGRIDVFEYDYKNNNRLFQANQTAERLFPAPGAYADLSEKGVEYKYHPSIAFPVKKVYYQYRNGKRSDVKTEISAYENADFTLSETIESGKKTKYWQNIYGEPAITLDANGSAVIHLYSPDCTFLAYEFKDGSINNAGYLSKKIATDDAGIIKRYFNELKVAYPLPAKKSSFSQTVQYSFSPDGKLIRSKNAISDNFSVINSYGDVLYSYSKDTGITITQYTAWGRPQYVLHQFCATDKDFQGEEIFGIPGTFYRESFEYDKYTLLFKHYKTNEPLAGGMVYQPFIYEREPSGKVRSITNPEGVTRVDERDGKSGLLVKQYVKAEDGKIALLNSDFTYYQDGIVKSVKNHLGGVNTNLIDGFGDIYAEITPLGVTTQKQINVLGQETAKWRYKDGKELARTENIYNEQNLLDSVKIFRYHESEKSCIDAKKYRYDAVGNVIAERGTQNDSWKYSLYDGLNRKIATFSPGGDIKFTFWGNDLPLCEMTILKNQDTEKQQRFGIYYEYDSCGRKIKETPVTHWGKLAEQRTIEYVYDTVGNQIRVVSSRLSSTEKTFNTLRKVTSEKQIPHSTEAGEVTSETVYKYNAAGQLVEKGVKNDALALVNKTDGIVPERKKAPQITKYCFDSLARNIKTIQPDGLVQENIYDYRSLPIKMKWYYEFDPDVTLRDFEIKYSVLGQCLSVKDAKSGKVIRQHAFDLLGNCIKSIDIDWQGVPIELSRKFDSIGTKREETVKYGDKIFPTQKFNYDLSSGKINKVWENLQRTSLKYWTSETFQMDGADRLTAITIDDSSEPFAKWHYLGSLPISRMIKESGVSNYITYNDFLEPESFTIKRNTSGQIIGHLQYGYGPQGQAEFSSSQLISENTGKSYNFSTYSSFDSFRRLVAQNAEQVLPAGGNWQQRAKTIFADPSQINLQALQTQRMKYDQANNIWVMYNGGFFNPVMHHKFTRKQNPFFISPAKPITLNNGKVQDMDLKELASNRDVTTAYFADNDILEAKVQKYDKLGCLVEFEGTYWNGTTRRPAIWKLTYDPFGRLIVMKGYASEDSNFDSIKKDDLLAELHFSYDSENRRIRKEVIDSCSHKRKDISFTVYTGIHQSLVFTEKDGKTVLQEQYLWNPGAQELLMATMLEEVAQGKNSIDTQRYYFQQDKGYNVIFTSKYGKTGFETVSAMSYLGFGENATKAEITEIRSSENERYRKYAFDKTLQNQVPGCWYGNSKRLHYLELQLAGNDNLSALKIWTANKFPETFAVFVLAPYQHLPSANSLQELVVKSKDNLAAIVENGRCYNKKKIPEWESPYNIPLLDKKGNRVVIVWDKSCNIEVREFEVTKVPNNPGVIAFAGQWLDRETDMYYQVNRYRLAGANKFISPDPLGYFDGNNLYAYAHNNPLEWHDPDGRWARILAGAGIGAVLGGGMYALNCWMNGTEFSWAEFGVSVFAGAASGAIVAALLPVNPILAGSVAGAVGGAIAEGGITYIRTGDWEKSLVAAGKGAVWGGMAGAFAGGLGIFDGSSSNFMMGLLQSTGVGTLTGGIFGGARQGFDVYCETGDWATTFYAAQSGAGQGAFMGGIAAASGYSLSRLFPVRNSNVTEEKPEAVDQTQSTQKSGGRYGELDTSIEKHGHHMPAKSASPLSIEDGPAILMDAADHRQTASYGSSKQAVAYREVQRQLTAKRDFEGAFNMDVADIHMKFGTKYDAAISQARDYLHSIPNL